MAEKFQDQGGVASMDPSPLKRWIASKVMSRMSSMQRLEKARARYEKQRLKTGSAHVVEYFHQVDDAYSHLAAQLLQDFAARYDIELVCHLVSGPRDKNASEPELLLKLSRYDAYHVAPGYGLEFPEHDQPPESSLVKLASEILAALDSAAFIECAADVGRALWAGDEPGLRAIADRLGSASQAQVKAQLESGTRRQLELKHYSGAMFYYGDEWFWGVDRLYLLEKRLSSLGTDRQQGQPPLVPRPPVDVGEFKDNGSLTLEVYASLRSPYTAIAFDRTVALARDAGVKLVVRPVLPMVMRGVQLTRDKGMYILMDTAREAQAAGVPHGKVYDPIGEPARRGYSLYSWACKQGKGNELFASFVHAAWADGVNTNSDKGLKTVVENTGLDWGQAKDIVGQPGWEDELESNRLAMYDAGLWGVPSFRLLDESGEQLLALWGQDRLWLVAREIQRQLSKQQQEKRE